LKKKNLQIDNYFLEVVSSTTLNEWNKDIEILADGTWRAVEETINPQLDSDDDEPPTKSNKQENEGQAGLILLN